MKRNFYRINLIGCFFCFILLSFFSFQPNAYPAPSSYFDTVQKTYIAYYGRPADPGGLVWWADVAERAGGMAAVINPFGISPEATALQAPYAGNTLALLDSLYWQFFGRAGDYGGMVWWADLIDRHVLTLPEAMWSMVTTGPQGDDIAAVANKLTAANLFTMTIDPDLDGSNFQATYEGEGDLIAGRNFLALYATSVRVPTQTETTAYIKANIADPGDPITTAAPIGLNRSNPYNRAQIVSAPHWDVKVIDTIRGSAAWQAISAANQFNDPPPAGMEYLLVKIHVKSTYTDNNTHSIGKYDFRVTGDSLRENKYASVVSPSPDLDADLFASGEAEGWAPYLVGIGEGKLILIVDESSNYTDGHRRFIALDDGASISVDPALGSITPTVIGSERNSPALLSQTVTTEDWEVSVQQVVRGEAAWIMVRDANQFNDPPAVGMEYVAAKLRARYISTIDESESTGNLYIKTTGSANVLYDNPWVVDPDPAFDDATLFPGGSYEGWVVTQVATGETGIMLVIETLFDFSDVNTRYLSLE